MQVDKYVCTFVVFFLLTYYNLNIFLLYSILHSILHPSAAIFCLYSPCIIPYFPLCCRTISFAALYNTIYSIQLQKGMLSDK